MISFYSKRIVARRSFWTLTGSPHLLAHPVIALFAENKDCSPAQAVYRLAQLRGVTPLSGTTQDEHMRADVAVENIQVDESNMKSLDEVIAWMESD